MFNCRNLVERFLEACSFRDFQYRCTRLLSPVNLIGNLVTLHTQREKHLFSHLGILHTYAHEDEKTSVFPLCFTCSSEALSICNYIWENILDTKVGVLSMLFSVNVITYGENILDTTVGVLSMLFTPYFLIAEPPLKPHQREMLKMVLMCYCHDGNPEICLWLPALLSYVCTKTLRLAMLNHCQSWY